jgi:hypothetical protein
LYIVACRKCGTPLQNLSSRLAELSTTSLGALKVSSPSFKALSARTTAIAVSIDMVHPKNIRFYGDGEEDGAGFSEAGAQCGVVRDASFEAINVLLRGKREIEILEFGTRTHQDVDLGGG